MMATSSADRAALYRKVAWRLLPLLSLLYVFNILDRANVGFARLTMQQELGMSQAVFDLGAGIFYLGYLAFEVPANLLMRRVGARRWIARIAVTWGLVSCATLLVGDPVSFYLVRILLGVAEAGFFPGIILYLTYWFPPRERVRVTAAFIMAIPVAGLVGNPLSGAILQYLDGAAGLRGWQWLFLLEGVPSVLFGVVALFVLPDGPHDAAWLSPDERSRVQAELEREHHGRQPGHTGDWVRALIDWRVWLLIATYFPVAVGANASGFYFPKLIADRFSGWNPSGVGLLAALPSLSAMVGMALVAINSDRTGERSGHVGFAAFLAAAGWTLSAVSESPALFLLGLCLAQTGMMSILPPFWALPVVFLSGAAAASGIALINSVANIGGIIAPNLFGAVGPYGMAALLFAGGLMALSVRQGRTPPALRPERRPA